MRGVRWKFRQGQNTWEGTVKGDKEASLFICGGLCVTDLRESYKSDVFVQPKHYKIMGLKLEEAKSLAEDLVTGDNFEKHETNRLAWIEEHKKTADTMTRAQEMLDKIKRGEI